MAFLALKKTESGFQYPFYPGLAMETRRDSRNGFFENETIFVLFMPRSRVNLTVKKNFMMPGNYILLINESEVITGKSQTNTLRPRSEISL